MSPVKHGEPFIALETFFHLVIRHPELFRSTYLEVISDRVGRDPLIRVRSLALLALKCIHLFKDIGNVISKLLGWRYC